MKTATVKELRQELVQRSPKELLDICLRLSRFKKENKELLTYLLFEIADEHTYIEGVKAYIDEAFAEINTARFFYIKKSVRKILKEVKKFIRYSQKKETEVELLIHFGLPSKEIVYLRIYILDSWSLSTTGFPSFMRTCSMIMR